jgi:hypothetical protein
MAQTPPAGVADYLRKGNITRALEIILSLILAIVALKLIGVAIHFAIVGAIVGLVIGLVGLRGRRSRRPWVAYGSHATNGNRLGQEARPLASRRSRTAFERQEDAGSLARYLSAVTSKAVLCSPVLWNSCVQNSPG